MTDIGTEFKCEEYVNEAKDEANLAEQNWKIKTNTDSRPVVVAHNEQHIFAQAAQLFAFGEHFDCIGWRLEQQSFPVVELLEEFQQFSAKEKTITKINNNMK